MGKIVISENVSLDGVVQDPTGEEGFARGGWFGQIKDRPEVAKLALDEALARRGPAARSAQLRVLRRALAVADRRVGGQVEQPAQVRRVLDSRRSGLEQLDRAERATPRARSRSSSRSWTGRSSSWPATSSCAR